MPKTPTPFNSMLISKFAPARTKKRRYNGESTVFKVSKKLNSDLLIFIRTVPKNIFAKSTEKPKDIANPLVNRTNPNV